MVENEDKVIVGEEIPTITIRLERGNVMVDAPMHDKLFCMGMLELAKVAIMNHNGARIIKPH